MAIIKEPNARVPRWNTVVLKIDVVKLAQGIFDLFLVQYHFAKTPANTISP